MIRAPALDQRDGARNDGALARTDAARQIGKIGSGGSATRRHSFALEPRPLGARAALPRASPRPMFHMKFNEITERHGGSSATGLRLMKFAHLARSAALYTDPLDLTMAFASLPPTARCQLGAQLGDFVPPSSFLMALSPSAGSRLR